MWRILLLYLIGASPLIEPDSPTFLLADLPIYATLTECKARLPRARADAVRRWQRAAVVICWQLPEPIEI